MKILNDTQFNALGGEKNLFSKRSDGGLKVPGRTTEILEACTWTI